MKLNWMYMSVGQWYSHFTATLGYVIRIQEEDSASASRIWLITSTENLTGGHYLRGLGVDGRIILKLLQKNM
jgi:hypothetical protein